MAPRFAYAIEGASGCSETAASPRSQGSGPQQPQAKHFSRAQPLRSSRENAGRPEARRPALPYFAKRLAAPGPGLGARVLWWALPSAAPVQGLRIIRNPQNPFRMEKGNVCTLSGQGGPARGKRNHVSKQARGKCDQDPISPRIRSEKGGRFRISQPTPRRPRGFQAGWPVVCLPARGRLLSLPDRPRALTAGY